ncbi:WD40 domain containing protein [Pyrrhoderma noxium]|uniref:WD40 domain containing protein n=1 Tax=Pyrrhoderma noxium TaxID=2282107 RepID=A0A286UX91_9AGAM|nr:WD40 domain containing protein [Pyrrhoderma noxium]
MTDKGKDGQTEISSPPFDGISSVKFSPTDPNHLLVASWDTTVRFYDTAANEQKIKFDHRAAVLDCCFASDGKHGFSGGLDTSVRELDLETEKFRHLGQHDAAVSQVCFSKETNQLISGSWDCTLRFWDPRAETSTSAPVETLNLPERVYCMDITNNFLVVGMASRLFHIYDLRQTKKLWQERESSLKFLTRSVACMSDGKGYATSSVEGRIAVEYFDTSAQGEKYAFKSHRQTINGEDHVWPVNALVFHPLYNTFASGGSDGSISIWDHKSRKRFKQYPRYPAPVTSLSFNCDGTKLAAGMSYNWDEGADGAASLSDSTGESPSPKIWIRETADDWKPKGM